ncbi:MAG: mechanosensitive ion channel family protein [Thermosynechococcaceae cyanobacterium]
MSAITDSFAPLIQQVVLFTPKLVIGLVIVIGFWFMSVVVQTIVRRLGKRSHLDHDLINLLRQVASTTVLILGVTVALGTMGIDVSAIVTGLGLTGFALGFALKDVLSNLLSGVLILAYRPFIRGDWITVSGLEGTVLEIDLRYTTLETTDNKILIPNSTLFSNPITVRHA